MLYSTTHSAHFIFSNMISNMVKNYSDNKRGYPLSPLHWLFDLSQGIFIMHHPPDKIVHTMAFGALVV